MLDIQNLTKRYGDEPAVEEVSLSVDRGEFLTLLGPSGCGKTTTLRAIAGHVTPTGGSIRLDGRELTPLPPEARSVGIVFQQDALFPHMTARENVSYALGPEDLTPSARRERTAASLELVNMGDHAEKYPRQLSGGQRRRVELARALVYEPDLLLLDEPLTGLDRQLRREMRGEIATVHEETNVTTIYVTHDQAEALTLSDRIAVLRDGELSAVGTGEALYERPPTEFVATFLGNVSRLRAPVVARDPPTVEWAGHRCRLDGSLPPDTDEVSLCLRPDAVDASLTGAPEARDVTFEGAIVDVSHTGPRSTITVTGPADATVSFVVAGFPAVGPGDRVAVGFDVTDLFAFAGNRRLGLEPATPATVPEQ